ncbi:MAG TPA: VOC family protein [Candidatus Dormibacteraeota bacterium]|nr:VOC family protein [Candidatus Dormibacteraeota bacterium]
MQKVIPCIWFESNAEEAMNFYTSAFPNSKIIEIERYAGDQGIPGEKELKGKVLTGIFEVYGLKLMCLDGGPLFKPGGNISLLVEFDTQEEIDAVWEKLLEGGKPQQCGWIVDKFGTTWQITPREFGEMMEKGTPAQKKALMAAMMPMVKLDLPKLKEAFESAK